MESGICMDTNENIVTNAELNQMSSHKKRSYPHESGVPELFQLDRQEKKQPRGIECA